MIKDNSYGIYIHVPFCDSKCNYCNFISGVCSEEGKRRYFNALRNEIKFNANREPFNSTNKKLKVDTIFLGGGTPSSVDAELIEQALNEIYQRFDVEKTAEITIECNPCSATFEKLQYYKTLGINRISFGGQSFRDDVLKILGRRHYAKDIELAVFNAQKAGFENINVDLIVGVKSFDANYLEIFEDKIKKLKKLGVKHFSVYMLILEEKTPLYNRFLIGEFNPLSEDETLKQYNFVKNILKDNDFSRYEISNFSLKGFECKHNIKYWELEPYIGFGVSAHSCVNNKRICLTESLSEYLQLNGENFPISNYDVEALNEKQLREEKLMLGLRLEKGIDLKSIDLLEVKNKEINELLDLGLIEIEDNYLKATSRGFEVLNQIILKLI